MARQRIIKPEIWTDENFVKLSAMARLLFIGLWNFADDKGVIKNSPLELKMKIFPAENLDCASLVKEIAKLGMIEIFEADGQEWVWIRNFLKHQKIDRPQPSKNPPPPVKDNSTTIRRQVVDNSTTIRRQVVDNSTTIRRQFVEDSLLREEKRREYNTDQANDFPKIDIDPEIQKAKDQMAEDLNPLIKAQNILISLGIDKANARRYATRGLSYVQKHVNYWKHEVDEARKTPEECVSWLAARLRDDRAPPLTYIDDCLLPDGTPDFSRMRQSYIDQDTAFGKHYYRMNRKGHREYWIDDRFVDEYELSRYLRKKEQKPA